MLADEKKTTTNKYKRQTDISQRKVSENAFACIWTARYTYKDIVGCNL